MIPVIVSHTINELYLYQQKRREKQFFQRKYTVNDDRRLSLKRNHALNNRNAQPNRTFNENQI